MTRVKFEGDGMRNIQAILHDGNQISFTYVTSTNYAVLLPDVTGQGIIQPVIRLVYQNGTSVDLDRGTYTYTNDPKVLDTLTTDRTEVLPGESPTVSTNLPSGYQMARWLDFSPQSGVATSSSGVAMASWSDVMTCSDTQDKTLEIRSYDSFFNPGFIQPAKLDNGSPSNELAPNEPFADQLFITYKAAPESTFCKSSGGSGSGSSSEEPGLETPVPGKSKTLKLSGFAGFSSVLTNSQRIKLIDFLGRNPGFTKVELSGFTSSTKNTKYLRTLAKNRTKSVWKVVSSRVPEANLVKMLVFTDLGITPKNRAVKIRLIF